MLELENLIVTCVACATMMPVARAGEKTAASAPAQSPPGVWTLTAPAYRVLSQATFFEALDKAELVGVTAIEGRPYKISVETGDAELGPSAPPEALEKTRRKLAEAGLKLVSYYAGDFGKDDAATRKLFEFGKAMGIQVFVGEPKPQKLPLLDRLANEFGITVAIHNHPKRPQQPSYTNWKPENVMRMIEKCSKRIGCCADTGHWVRSGLDPVECLKKCEGRLVCLHLKDVNEKGPLGRDVILGTGVANAKAMLAELHRQKFTGLISFEYESKEMKDRPADVDKTVSFVRESAKELGQKVN